MQAHSYTTLDAFKNALLAADFLTLPDDPSEEEALPFQKIFGDHRSQLLASLESDLTGIGANILDIEETIFTPVDNHAQGATLCHIYTALVLNGVTLPVAFKYLVFQNAIKCYLYGNMPTSLIDQLTASSQSKLQPLARTYGNPDRLNLHEILR